MTKVEEIRELTSKRQRIIERLVQPAKAALNQMKDAGMKSGAAPLEEILFEYDAVEQEIKDYFAADPKGTIEALIDMIGGKRSDA